MNLIHTLERLGLVTPTRRALPAAQAGISGRPTYANQYTSSTIPRAESQQLLAQFRRNIPVLNRAVDILSGFVGCPAIVSDSEALATELETWSDNIAFGYVGRGLGSFLRDHLAQALVYGYAVGEMEIAPGRNEVSRLWSYLSTSCGFRSQPDGAIDVLQQSGSRQLTLDPLSVLITSHAISGTNPRGESLFYALPLVCQVWQEILYAFRSTWRRNGIPTFHTNWQPPDGFNDPDGSVATTVVTAMTTQFNEAMRSQVMDGRAKDFFSSGKITISSIGADAPVLDIQVSKRQIVEEIVVATGIPPWMLGYSWSTTERLSQQQADMLVSTIESLRRELEPAGRKLVEMQVRLAARKGAWDLVWPDVSLQDSVEQARGELFAAQAENTRQKTQRQMWADGVISQADYSMMMTGNPDIIMPMDTPPAMTPDSSQAPDMQAARALEERDEYPFLRAKQQNCNCGNKISADDPAQLWPNERPQYEQLERSVSRAWRATQAVFAPLRAAWLREARAGGRRAAKDALPPENLAAINIAQADFLAQFAGTIRTMQQFASGDTPDGILQQAEVDAWHAGTERAAEQLRWPMNPAFTRQQREALLRIAFERMSENGHLRFETRLDEIKQRMLDGFDRGESPLKITRQLSADLDSYERYRLGMIVRTEMGLASEAGIRELYREAAVTEVQVIGDPNTDSLCTSRIGHRYPIGDEENLPLYHPHCGCSVIPVVEASSD